jgi:uncharacterized protein (DUF697 family)/tellurite resistance protein
MNDAQRKAMFTLSLQAALADGITSSAERSALENIAAKLRAAGIPLDLPAPGSVSRTLAVRDLVQDLRDPEVAREAFETAVAVCEVDEPANQAEKWFLDELRRELGLDPAEADQVRQQADAIAASPVTVAAPPVLTAAVTPVATSNAASPAEAELERSILHHSILAGALELLPSKLATMAIVPLQMRLVYQIGKSYGYELDRGHIKDFLATAGVGLASQVVESYAERLVRGLVGKFAGGLVRGLVGQATSSGMSFATTWALGQLARQYYAGGRRFGAIEIRDLYDRLMGEGRSLQSNYLPQMREQAGKLNLSTVTSMLRT